MNQDQVYKNIEADQFHDRYRHDFKKLPIKKKSLIDNFSEILKTEKVNTILEVGCHIGDLLNYAGDILNATKRIGVEPSSKAVAVGKSLFPMNTYIDGVVSELNKHEPVEADLIIINDVFCWISRETLFQSLSNIDGNLKIGGRLLIRDFYPAQFTANKNKHVKDFSVYCYKIPGSHGKLFLDSGKYNLLNSRVFSGEELSLSQQKFEKNFEDRWIEMCMVKVA